MPIDKFNPSNNESAWWSIAFGHAGHGVICSAVISCQLLIDLWVLVTHPPITDHSFTKAIPLNTTSSSQIPAQLHCHSRPAAGNLPPPPQPPPLSTYESTHGRGKRYSSWTNVSCLLRPPGGSAHFLACCLANPGNIQRKEPFAPSITVFPIVQQMGKSWQSVADWTLLSTKIGHRRQQWDLPCPKGINSSGGNKYNQIAKKCAQVK